MHRRYLRATVGGQEVDIQTSNFIAGGFVRFIGGVLVTTVAVRGPVSSTLNAIARWDVITGDLLKDSTVLIDDAGNITGVGTIDGIPVLDFVRGPTPAVAVDNHIATWDLTSGRLIQDSGLHIGDVVYNFDAEAVAGHIPEFADSTGRRLTDSGLIADNVVQSTTVGAIVDNSVARWDGTTGRFIQNSAVIIGDTGNITGVGTINGFTLGNWVVGPASAVSSQVALYNGTSGKVIKASTVTIGTGGYMQGVGDIEMTGAINNVFIDFTTANMSGVGTLNARTISRWVDGPVSPSSTDNAIARWDSITGRLIQNSVVLISDAGDITGVTGIGGIDPANWVRGPASAVNGNLAAFSGTDGKAIFDTGIANTVIATHVVGPASSTDSAVALFNGATGKLIQSSGIIVGVGSNVIGLGTLNTRTIANWVDGPASAVSGNVAVFSGTTGKLVSDSGFAVANAVQGPAVATDNAVARFDTTTGKLIQNSVVTISDTGDIAGVTAINSIAILNYAITSSGNSIGRVPVYNSGTSFTQSQVVISTGGVVSAVSTLNGIDPATWVIGPNSATDGRVAVYDGATGKLLKNGTKLEADVVTGPSSATDGLVAVFNGITGKVIKVGTRQEAVLVAGPAVAADNAIARFDATTGKLIQDSVVTIDDAGAVTGITSLNGGSAAGLGNTHIGPSASSGTVSTTFTIGSWTPISTAGDWAMMLWVPIQSVTSSGTFGITVTWGSGTGSVGVSVGSGGATTQTSGVNITFNKTVLTTTSGLMLVSVSVVGMTVGTGIVVDATNTGTSYQVRPGVQMMCLDN